MIMQATSQMKDFRMKIDNKYAPLSYERIDNMHTTIQNLLDKIKLFFATLEAKFPLGIIKEKESQTDAASNIDCLDVKNDKN